MTVIRLARLGRKKRPSYRIVVTDSRKRRDSGYKESIGIYDPISKDKTLRLDKERYDYWLKVGAKPSETVQALAKK
ncbi:MAG: 30S ribosomal protein S16 [Helicobacteraceae bacterium]